MSELIHTPLFGLLLTLASFKAAGWLYHKAGRTPLLHPFAVAMIPVVLVLKALDIQFSEYLDQTTIIQFLLGPATVALGWPMYRQLHTLGGIWKRLVVLIVICVLVVPAICVGIAWAMGAPLDMLSSLAPKSITTPIALGVVELTGGIAALTAGVVALTGIVGAICAPSILKWMKITDDRVKGLTIGITSHAIGTARAFEISEKAGAFSSLALSLMGALTAVVIPLVWAWLSGYL